MTPIRCGADAWAHQDVRPGDTVAWPTNLGWMMGPWLLYAALLNGACIALYQVGDAAVPCLPSLLNCYVAARPSNVVCAHARRVIAFHQAPAGASSWSFQLSHAAKGQHD